MPGRLAGTRPHRERLFATRTHHLPIRLFVELREQANIKEESCGW
jgi:hypothetical protein